MSRPASADPPPAAARLISLDALRGFVMLWIAGGEIGHHLPFTLSVLTFAILWCGLFLLYRKRIFLRV